MVMNAMRPAFIPFLTLILTATSIASGQDASSRLDDWKRLMLIPPGDEIVIKRKDGKTMQGRLVGATEHAITLTRKKKLVEIDRSGIDKVFRRVQKHGESSTSTGASIGALAGLVLGIAAGASSSEDEVSVVGAAIGLALIGAGIGALIGAVFDVKPPTVLVYQAR
jgi:hypothetical protein